jgi:hypothetical protein
VIIREPSGIFQEVRQHHQKEDPWLQLCPKTHILKKKVATFSLPITVHLFL